MVLQVCEGCGRHVRADETACPFCRAPIVGDEPRPVRAGRFARAVMVAGAALAGCDQGKEDKAAPPEEPAIAKEPIPTPRVHGNVTDSGGTPLVGAQVVLMGTTTYQGVSDHKGRYAFNEIAPGTYRLSVGYTGYNAGSEFANGHSEREVTVGARSDKRADVTLALQYQQPALPYGAPPARRRVV